MSDFLKAGIISGMGNIKKYCMYHMSRKQCNVMSGAVRLGENRLFIGSFILGIPMYANQPAMQHQKAQDKIYTKIMHARFSVNNVNTYLSMISASLT